MTASHRLDSPSIMAMSPPLSGAPLISGDAASAVSQHLLAASSAVVSLRQWELLVLNPEQRRSLAHPLVYRAIFC